VLTLYGRVRNPDGSSRLLEAEGDDYEKARDALYAAAAAAAADQKLLSIARWPV